MESLLGATDFGVRQLSGLMVLMGFHHLSNDAMVANHRFRVREDEDDGDCDDDDDDEGDEEKRRDTNVLSSKVQHV